MLTSTEIVIVNGVRTLRTWTLLSFAWNPVLSYRDEAVETDFSL
jgi:hypothetical protein